MSPDATSAVLGVLEDLRQRRMPKAPAKQQSIQADIECQIKFECWRSPACVNRRVNLHAELPRGALRFTCQKLQQARVLSAIRWMTSSLIPYDRRAVKLQELRNLRHELDSEVRDSTGKSDVRPVGSDTLRVQAIVHRSKAAAQEALLAAERTATILSRLSEGRGSLCDAEFLVSGLSGKSWRTGGISFWQMH